MISFVVIIPYIKEKLKQIRPSYFLFFCKLATAKILRDLLVIFGIIWYYIGLRIKKGE